MHGIVTVVLLAAATGPLRAQSDDNAPIILELPASTRALGLGGAFVLSGMEPEAVFLQPGALTAARGMGLAMQRYGGDAALGMFAAARQWAGGTLAVGLQALTYGTGGVGVSLAPDDADRLLLGGPIGAAELVGSVGYGREIVGVRVGLVAKVIEQRVGGDRDATGAVDVGVVKRFIGLTWGVTAQNLGPDVELGAGDIPLPRRVAFGVSTSSTVVGPLDVVATGAVTRRRDGEVIPAGGVEVSWWPVIGRTFIGRVGLRRTPNDGGSFATFGLAFRGDDITIEYAFEGFAAPGSAHRIGLRWR